MSQKQLDLLNTYCEQKIVWDKSTKDPDFPYRSEFNGQILVLRLNDFPAEPLYTLIVNDDVVGSINDWPVQWVRFD